MARCALCSRIFSVSDELFAKCHDIATTHVSNLARVLVVRTNSGVLAFLFLAFCRPDFSHGARVAGTHFERLRHHDNCKARGLGRGRGAICCRYRRFRGRGWLDRSRQRSGKGSWRGFWCHHKWWQHTWIAAPFAGHDAASTKVEFAVGALPTDPVASGAEALAASVARVRVAKFRVAVWTAISHGRVAHGPNAHDTTTTTKQRHVPTTVLW